MSFFLLAVIIACTGPTSAEPPPTLSQASYDADTQRLTLTLSDGSTIQADLNDFVTSGELPAAVSDALPQTAAPTPAPPTVSGSSYDPTTQLLTLTRTDGSAFQADLGSLATYDELSTMAPDVSVESARYDNATTQLLLTLSDDSIIRADLSRLSTDTDLAAVVLDNAELVATLIASQPTPQEPITVQDASYDARTTTLTLTLSDRTTIQADLNALITTTELTAVVAALPATPTPVPTPTPTPAPAMVEQARTFDLSVPDMGQPNFSLSMQDYLPQRTDGITTHEAMFATDAQGMVVARLVTAYELNAAGLVYTFHLRKGVPWHNNHGEWGEFDADDFLFSWQGAAVPSSLHPIAEDSRRTFTCEACQMVKVDDHTVQLIRTTPTGEITWHSRMPLRASLSMHSKKHYDAKGAEEANRESVGTGPWVLTSATTGVDRRFEAVLDHWNKSPEFAEMIWHEIYEESTRRAVFLSRQIDTGSFTPESIQVIRNEDFADVKYMSFPGAIGVYLNLLGQQYYTDHPHHLPDANGDIRVPLDENAYDCSFAWVSCDRDTESEEWDNARKVRQAMNHSIDRQKLINNLAFGEGPAPLPHLVHRPFRPDEAVRPGPVDLRVRRGLGQTTAARGGVRGRLRNRYGPHHPALSRGCGKRRGRLHHVAGGWHSVQPAEPALLGIPAYLGKPSRQGRQHTGYYRHLRAAAYHADTLQLDQLHQLRFGAPRLAGHDGGRPSYR